MTTDRGIAIYFENLAHAEQADSFGQIGSAVKEISEETERALIAIDDMFTEIACTFDNHEIRWDSDEGRLFKAVHKRAQVRIDVIANAIDEALQLVDRCSDEAA